jgi:hypothetical protein
MEYTVVMFCKQTSRKMFPLKSSIAKYIPLLNKRTYRTENNLLNNNIYQNNKCHVVYKKINIMYRQLLKKTKKNKKKYSKSRPKKLIYLII